MMTPSPADGLQGNTLPFNPEPQYFGGRPHPLDEALVVYAGVPVEASPAPRPGSRLAPREVRIASLHVTLYALYTRLDLSKLPAFHDAGDVWSPAPLDAVEAAARLLYRARRSRRGAALAGGEHIVTLSYGLASRDVKRRLLIVFDAHLDLLDEYRGYRYSGPATLTRLIENGFDPSDVMVIGVRGVSDATLEKAERLGVTFYMLGSADRGIREAIRAAEEAEWLHISVDMDVFDPGFAPGAVYPEPPGLTPAVVLEAVARLANATPGVVTLDVVEYSPLYDCGGATAALAAKLIIEYAGGVACKRLSSCRIRHRG